MVKAELWREEKLDEKPDVLFEEAALFALNLAASEGDYRTKVRHINYWRECFSGRSLRSLTANEIINNLPTHQQKRKVEDYPRKLKNSTKNRYLSTMLRILNLAHANGQLAQVPKITKLKEPKVRIRWITHWQAAMLIECISLKWMQRISIFALSTGARMSEILTLEWSNIDLDNEIAWLYGDRTKSGHGRAVPLNEDAMLVLHECLGLHEQYVFVRDTGVRPKDICRRSFNNAVKLAKIKDFTFHDLRHTWASWHAQSGTPLYILQELGGWESIDMVQKYAHFNAEHLREYIDSSSMIKKTRFGHGLKKDTKKTA